MADALTTARAAFWSDLADEGLVDAGALGP